jgi:hypothetical protein
MGLSADELRQQHAERQALAMEQINVQHSVKKAVAQSGNVVAA